MIKNFSFELILLVEAYGEGGNAIRAFPSLPYLNLEVRWASSSGLLAGFVSVRRFPFSHNCGFQVQDLNYWKVGSLAWACGCLFTPRAFTIDARQGSK
jgi:hypothetical protein